MTSSLAFQGASSSSSFTCGWQAFDVFLSFRGKDTRNNFTAHLYDALDRKGIKTYKDDVDLRRGDIISPTLVKAIEESRISIIVFSQNYASSSWCLNELVKILECKEMKGQTVLPVFYHVHPCEIRDQKNSVGEAFAKLDQESIKDDTKVRRWKTALTELSNLAGWHLENGNESKYIHTIVEEISSRVGPPHLDVAQYPIGIESRVKKINVLLNLEMNDMCMVGIFGIFGIGKTTIAKAIYNSIAYRFQGSCFLENVGKISGQPHGLVRLQEMLLSKILGDSCLKIGSVDQGINLIKQKLSSKKVLLILDGVDQLLQLEALAGQRDWFGLGSRIIATARDENLLTKHEVDATYKVDELNPNEALKLFCWHAFQKDKPEDNYMKLTEHAIHSAGGLPLALIILGSSLCGRSVAEWRSALGRDKRIPDILLEMASFFKEERAKYVILKILDGCDSSPNIGIKVHKDKPFITIDPSSTLMMHDLLQEMDGEIVREELPKELDRGSKAWFREDEENTGGKKVEGIFLNQVDLREQNLNDWPEYSSQSFPSNFRGKKVVSFEMPNSLFTRIDELKNNFNNLTSLEFSNCKFLTKIPDLSKSPNLEELILEKCTNLVEVHHSVGLLDKLVLLSLSRCFNLGSLPTTLKLRSLQCLNLEGCSSLQNFSEIGCEMGYLRSLDLRRTGIKKLPSSIRYLTSLQFLNLSDCRSLVSLSGIHQLEILRTLSLSGCSKLSEFPLQPPMNLSISNGGDSSVACLAPQSYSFRSFNCSSTLEELDLSGCELVSTICFKRFIRLRRLILVDCKKLEEIIELPPNIEEVNAGGCISLERFPEVSKRFESNTGDLPGLVWVDLSRCEKLLENMENDVEKFLSVKGNLEDYPCGIIFPGNKIPSWFSYQKQTSISDICEIDISEASCLDGEITGMALCAVIGLKDEPQIPLPIICVVEIINGLSRHYETKKFHLSGSDHSWLHYHIPKFHELKGDNVRVKFKFWNSTGLAFFKSCGVHLVRRYEEKGIDQMLNPQVQGVLLEDVEDPGPREEFEWSDYSSEDSCDSSGTDEPSLFKELSNREEIPFEVTPLTIKPLDGPGNYLVESSSLREEVVPTGNTDGSDHGFPGTPGLPVRVTFESKVADITEGVEPSDADSRGSSSFELRQTLAAALAELEFIWGQLEHSEAVREVEKANAFNLGMELGRSQGEACCLDRQLLLARRAEMDVVARLGQAQDAEQRLRSQIRRDLRFTVDCPNAFCDEGGPAVEGGASGVGLANDPAPPQARYSGDWSRIRMIAKEAEDLLKLAALVVVPFCIFLIFSFSREPEA